ncbi:tRNA pseudouridine(13) synthase TruD [Candidatus Woesearchaeota archaeon]|jgi:tRNA pseudouridine13 synthase|nr:tRNA pseudouridine(13) synthase TruD [Candidatus Woesearchaeota archaeon]MBT4248013.1 tRNA pseudouridine(13) synthase TruD [Candidatus Woesearchaeota archaeon]
MKIKQSPQDFIVDEVSIVKPKKTGEYAYFLLKKENWTTQRAIQQVARKLRVSAKRIGFAGNKDRHAITTQVCSAWETSAERIEWVILKDIKLKVLGRGDERINLGDLKGNKFKIIVREVSKKELANLEKNFDTIKKNGFMNLFGEQRFGSAGNGHLIGRAIIRGNLKDAVKLFLTEHGPNEEATKFGKYTLRHWGDWKKVAQECPRFLGLEMAILQWLIQYPKDFGGSLRNIPKPTRRIFISAYQSDLWNKEAMKTKLKTLKIPPVKVERMPELTMLGAERDVIIKPKNLKKTVEGDIVKLNFELPRGCYATELIRQLFDSP